jgi:transmembrane 9 superfamily protein 3
MVLTAAFFPFVCLCIMSSLNAITWYYDSQSAFRLMQVATLIGIWFVVALPLTLLGTLVGRSIGSNADFPCRVSGFLHPPPQSGFWTNPWVLSLLSGLLPFGSVLVEMFFVFTSFWNYKVYYMYTFVLLVYVLLVVVTVCSTIVSTYFLLNAEDYRWCWTSFTSGASAAVYAFIYGIYFLVTKTNMSGYLQISFFFGYITLFSLVFGLITGAVGFIASNMFVRKIYAFVKQD